MTLLDSHFTIQHVHNPRSDRTAPYGDEARIVLEPAACAAARREIETWPGYAPTPLLELPGIAAQAGFARLWYKDEAGRFGLGSFKALGGAFAVSRILIDAIRRQTGQQASTADLLSGLFGDITAGITVTCATDGNHGRSVAWGAQQFGCRCVIYIHATVSEGRKQAIEQLPEIPSHVFLQGRVGGFAAAVIARFWERCGAGRPRLVVVEPDRAACIHASIRAGSPIAVEGELDTLMAGLACGEVSLLAWEILKHGMDDVLTVSDPAAVACMRLLADGVGGDAPLVAGESAVAGLAGAVLVGQHPPLADAMSLDRDSRALVIGTEGDTDPEVYQQLVGRTAAEVRAA